MQTIMFRQISNTNLKQLKLNAQPLSGKAGFWHWID
jgi:hypothetical protein